MPSIKERIEMGETFTIDDGPICIATFPFYPRYQAKRAYMEVLTEHFWENDGLVSRTKEPDWDKAMLLGYYLGKQALMFGYRGTEILRKINTKGLFKNSKKWFDEFMKKHADIVTSYKADSKQRVHYRFLKDGDFEQEVRTKDLKARETFKSNTAFHIFRVEKL